MPQSRDKSEGAACERWEALLADAVDGEVRTADQIEFASHMAACADCRALFDAARRGRQWLEFLAAEPETPAGMLDRILAKTGPGHEAVYPTPTTPGAGAALPEPWQLPGPVSLLRRLAEPRLMLTVAMAFFSTALTLSLIAPRVAPVLATVRIGSLHPALVRAYVERQLATASVPIVRYYDHLQLVNQVQSTVKELQRTQQGSGAGSPGNTAPPAGTGNLRGIGKPRRTAPAQQVAAPAAAASQGETEALLRLDSRPGQMGSSTVKRERNKSWTA